MATAKPSSRCGASAGCSSASRSKSCFTDAAGTSSSATPPVSCARLPISTTRAMKPSGLGGLLLFLERLEYLGGRHRQLGEPDAGGRFHGVGDGSKRRDDGGFANAADTVRVLGIAHLDEDGVDHGHVRGDGHAVVEEARVLELAVGPVDILLVQRPADALHRAALELPLDVGR